MSCWRRIEKHKKPGLYINALSVDNMQPLVNFWEP